MPSVFVFNGDADGLCALQQLWLDEGFTTAHLLTGPKRRIALVREAVPLARPGDCVTVLDVSLASNAEAVAELLASGVRVRYFDHHHPGVLPDHPELERHIDASPDVCTSVLVDRHVGGRHRLWAVTGAFGDNLEGTARRLAASCGLAPEEVDLLRRTGIALNYNAYGESEADLFFAPRALHERLRPYRDPREFARRDPAFRTLWDGYTDDMARAAALKPYRETEGAALYVLPAETWARRVNGVLANDLAAAVPGRAHALAAPDSNGALTVSVRAPRARPFGAAALCMRFRGGGGREGAAGINGLPFSDLDRFAAEFFAAYA